MKYKKLIILAIFLVSLLAVSVVSAANNNTSDIVSVDENINNSIGVDEAKLDEISSFETSDENNEISYFIENENISSLDDNEDILSSSPPYNAYSVSVSDVSINYGDSGSIKMSINPVSGYDYYYDFYLRVYDSSNNLKIDTNIYGSYYVYSKTYNLDANSLNPGVYTIKIINYQDNHVMDTAKLTIKSGYSVSVSDVSINYGDSGSIKMSITPASRYGDYRYNYYLKVYDSDGVQKISQRYYSYSSSYSETYSLDANSLKPGVYTIKIINYQDSNVMDTAKLTIKPSQYSVSVSDVSINYGDRGSIRMSITPASGYGDYKYNYYLKVYDSDGVEKISQRYCSYSSSYSETYSLDANSLKPGIYTIKILDYNDYQVKDTANLTVISVPSSAYSVSLSDVWVNYGSSGSIKMYISPASGKLYKYDFYLKVYGSDGVEKISQRYYSTGSSYSKTYNLPANSLVPGLYTIKILNYGDNHVMDAATLTVESTLPYYAYSVNVKDVAIKYGSFGTVNMSINPASSNYGYKYDFYLKVYDSDGVEKISQRYYSTGSSSSKSYNLKSNSLDVGVYTIKIFNDYDNQLMDTAKLTVYKRIIQYATRSGNCTSNTQYKVRVSENGKAVSGEKVVFTCDGKKYTVVTDDQGYATLDVHLASGIYEITSYCGGVTFKSTLGVNSDFVENDYKNMYVKSMTGRYNGKNKINYGWDGNFEGYFKIYKANKLLYKTKLNTNGYVHDYMVYDKHNYYYEGSAIKAVGTYKAVITNVNGKQLAKATIKILKAPTHAKSDSLMTGMGGRDTFSAYIFDESNSNKGIGGTAKFKMFGKTYKVKVKNGVATVKRIKLPLKAKTYNCKVIFSGDKNYKGSSAKFKIKLSNQDVVILNKNRSMKIGKYTIKLTSSQYNSLIKAFNKDKTKVLKIKTDCKYYVEEPYTKTVNTYKTTTCCKTLYAGDYMPTMQRMKSAGWRKVSEYTYTKQNPRNIQGVGLSAYTFAVTKWVKTYYTTAYKTNSYPVYAKIIFEKGDCLPGIELRAHDTFLDYRYIAIK